MSYRMPTARDGWCSQAIGAVLRRYPGQLAPMVGAVKEACVLDIMVVRLSVERGPAPTP